MINYYFFEIVQKLFLIVRFLKMNALKFEISVQFKLDRESLWKVIKCSNTLLGITFKLVYKMERFLD